MPDLLRYQLRDGPHAGEPPAERGEIEQLARDCQAAECQDGLDSTVVETRLNVVRSSVPETVTTGRRLHDYLSPADLAGAAGLSLDGHQGGARPAGSGQVGAPHGACIVPSATPT